MPSEKDEVKGKGKRLPSDRVRSLLHFDRPSLGRRLHQNRRTPPSSSDAVSTSFPDEDGLGAPPAYRSYAPSIISLPPPYTNAEYAEPSTSRAVNAPATETQKQSLAVATTSLDPLESAIISGAWPPVLPRLPSNIALPSLHGRFVTQTCDTIILNRRILAESPCNYCVNTSLGEIILRIRCKDFMTSGSAEICDIKSDTVMTFQRRSKGDGDIYFYCETSHWAEGTYIGLYESAAAGTAVNAGLSWKGRDKVHSAALYAEGDNGVSRFLIRDRKTKAVVAAIDQQGSGRGQDETSEPKESQNSLAYAVTIAPGMEVPIVVAMCIAMDDLRSGIGAIGQ